MELDLVVVSAILFTCIANQKGSWIISLFTAGTLTGFDASGHIAEETRNARYVLFLSKR